jgi:hypothetical protein
MNGEKKIIIAGVVILVFGIGKAALDKKPLDVPLVGGITFILLLSLLSAISEPFSDLAGDFALLGMTAVLLIDGPQVLQQVNKQQTTGASVPKPTTFPTGGTSPGGTGATP